MKTPGKKKRPGRPPGSVSLTDEIADKIIAYIRAGVFDYVAAEAAGVPARTFRDWIARGEGRHPTRSCTPKLKAFAAAVRQAHAEARAGAEIRVYRDNPKKWLAHAARTKPGREGWTESRKQAEPGWENTLEARLASLDASGDRGSD